MAKMSTREDHRQIFKQKDKLVKEQPFLHQAYLQFLQDLNRYRELQQVQEKRQKGKQELRDYLIFGASFER